MTLARLAFGFAAGLSAFRAHADIVTEQLYVQQAQTAQQQANYFGSGPSARQEDFTGTNAAPAFAYLLERNDDLNMAIDESHGSRSHHPHLTGYRSLLVLADRAAQASDPATRRVLFGRFLDQSAPFVKIYPRSVHLAILRGAAALQLGRPDVGRASAERLLALPASVRADPHVQKLLTLLTHKGWAPGAGPGLVPAAR